MQIGATLMTDTHNRFLGDRALSPETLMMGYGYDPFLSERSLKPPVFHTSTFVFRSAQDGKEFFELAYGLRRKRPNEEPGLIYSRINNPDLEMLEDRLAIWDQAEASLVFASGIAAFYIETPANPTNGMVDLEHARKIVSDLHGPDGKRPVIIVDNTLLGPIYQTPLAHGADLVVTSLTKYVGGHSDLIAGGCSGAAAILEPIRGMRTILGTMCDPHTGWLLMRSLETLKLRMTAAAEGARKVAAFLNTHPKVASVWYLGFLPQGHPDRPVFERQCKSPGSTFSFEVKGGEAEAFAVLDRLKVIKLAVSLGGTETETLASHPAAMTHSDIPEEERLRLGITPALIRISVGIEDPDDLIVDLSQALG